MKAFLFLALIAGAIADSSNDSPLAAKKCAKKTVPKLTLTETLTKTILATETVKETQYTTETAQKTATQVILNTQTLQVKNLVDVTQTQTNQVTATQTIFKTLTSSITSLFNSTITSTQTATQYLTVAVPATDAPKTSYVSKTISIPVTSYITLPAATITQISTSTYTQPASTITSSITLPPSTITATVTATVTSTVTPIAAVTGASLSKGIVGTTTTASPSTIPTITNLLKNGGFEDAAEPYCASTLSWCIVDHAAVYPWISSDKKVEIDHTPWSNQEGKVSIDLSHNTPYTLSQAVTLTAGSKYNLTFWMFENAACGAANKTMTVSLGPNLAQNFTHVKGSGWVKQTYLFNAAAAQTNVTFISTTAGSCGPVIDNVSLVAA